MDNRDAPLLSLENVSFSYDTERDVLQNINLTLDPGDFLVVLGANGAGKSTLCYLLSGVIPNIYGGTRRGSVCVDGLDPWEQPMYAMAEHCGLVLQDPETQLLMPRLDMELFFGPANMGVARDEVLERAAHFLGVVGLKGLEARSTRALSGGQKQRAALASILTMMPRVLVLDEPTSQLDPLGSQEVVEALRNLARRHNITVVMTTHKLDEVLSMATHCLLLDNGRPARQGTFEEVAANAKFLDSKGVQAPVLFDVLTSLGATPDELTGQNMETGLELVKKKVAGGSSSRLSVEPPAVSRGPSRDDGDDPTQREVVLQIRDLEVTYPGPPPVTALTGVNLDVHEGEFVGVVGQNGSGKTTLVKTIVGLLKPSRGSISYRGQPLAKKRAGEITRHIGLVLQNPDYQLFNISVESEVTFGLKNLNLDPKVIAERVDEALKTLGLEDEKDTFPFKLSFGDRRKLSVAAILAMGTDVLILDEPTTAQDYRGRYLLADVADELRRNSGHAVIMITHDMDLVARYATRLLVLNAGRVLADGLTADVFQLEDSLAEAWLRPPAAARIARALNLPRDIMTPESLMDCIDRIRRGGE
jgi:energy-coupling factor transport system ATP-binding protein